MQMRKKQLLDVLLDDDDYTLRKDALPRPEDILHKQDVLGMSEEGEMTLPLMLAAPSEKCIKKDLSPVHPQAQLREYERPPSAKKDDVAVRLEQLMCDQEGHHPGISPIYVCKAMREFAVKFNEDKGGEVNQSLPYLAEKKRYTLARLLKEVDVEAFWKRYCQLFTKEKRSLWHALLLQMKDYYRLLLRRHNLNEQIKSTKRSNAELRQLLQRYTQPQYSNEDQKNLYYRIKTFLENEPEVIYPPALSFGLGREPSDRSTKPHDSSSSMSI